MNQPNNQQTFLGHLDELRRRLLLSLAAVVVAAAAMSFFSGRVLSWLIRPVGTLVFTAPAEAFSAKLVIIVLGGVIIALPVIVYQIWRFIALGLKPQEQNAVRIFAPLSFLCFILGLLFAFSVMIPISLKFLLGFSSQDLRPMITVKNYVSFVGTLAFVCGLIFELPIVLAFLAKIGIATPEFLRQKRKLALVIIMVASAVLTPPDVATQLMMAVPLIVLYEVGIVVTAWVQRTK